MKITYIGLRHKLEEVNAKKRNTVQSISTVRKGSKMRAINSLVIVAALTLVHMIVPSSQAAVEVT